MDKIPADKYIKEALRRTRMEYEGIGEIEKAIKEFKRFWPNGSIMHLAHMIEKYEPESVIDPALKRAREIYAENILFKYRNEVLDGTYDESPEIISIVHALKENFNG